jgi:hypothetical protein
VIHVSGWLGYLILAVVVAGFVVLFFSLRLLAKVVQIGIDRQAAAKPAPRRCASCHTPIDPAGPPPVEVQEQVTALIGRGPIPVRFYICQSCAALPEGATA